MDASTVRSLAAQTGRDRGCGVFGEKAPKKEMSKTAGGNEPFGCFGVLGSGYGSARTSSSRGMARMAPFRVVTM